MLKKIHSFKLQFSTQQNMGVGASVVPGVWNFCWMGVCTKTVSGGLDQLLPMCFHALSESGVGIHSFHPQATYNLIKFLLKGY